MPTAPSPPCVVRTAGPESFLTSAESPLFRRHHDILSEQTARPSDTSSHSTVDTSAHNRACTATTLSPPNPKLRTFFSECGAEFIFSPKKFFWERVRARRVKRTWRGTSLHLTSLHHFTSEVKVIRGVLRFFSRRHMIPAQ